MKKLLAGLAGALTVALFASASQAAPLGGASKATGTGVQSEIIQVHGIHGACRLDRFGWHRSYVWGRQRCAPPRWKHHHRHHHHHHKHWKKR